MFLRLVVTTSFSQKSSKSAKFSQLTLLMSMFFSTPFKNLIFHVLKGCKKEWWNVLRSIILCETLLNLECEKSDLILKLKCYIILYQNEYNQKPPKIKIQNASKIKIQNSSTVEIQSSFTLET